MEREIQVDKDYTFTFKKYVNGLQIIPSASTVTITDNGGTAVQSGAASIDSEGTITYTLLAANNDTVKANFKLVLNYTYSTAFEEAYTYDVVKYPLRNVASDIDMYLYLKELRNKIFTVEGTTDSNGSLSTLQDDMLKSDDRDFLGGKIEIFVLDTKVHEANITTYVKSTGLITFSPSYSSTITTGLKYVARESYQPLLDEAFNEYVIKDIRQKCKYAGGYINSNFVKNMTVFKALYLYCFQSIETEGDKWSIRANEYKQNYSDELIKMNEAYDTDEDGSISDTEADDKMSWMTRKIKR